MDKTTIKIIIKIIENRMQTILASNDSPLTRKELLEFHSHVINVVRFMYQFPLLDNTVPAPNCWIDQPPLTEYTC